MSKLGDSNFRESKVESELVDTKTKIGDGDQKLRDEYYEL